MKIKLQTESSSIAEYDSSICPRVGEFVTLVDHAWQVVRVHHAVPKGLLLEQSFVLVTVTLVA